MDGMLQSSALPWGARYLQASPNATAVEEVPNAFLGFVSFPYLVLFWSAVLGLWTFYQLALSEGTIAWWLYKVLNSLVLHRHESELHLGSISLSVLGGRISFSDLRYANRNFAVTALRGSVLIRWWTPFSKVRDGFHNPLSLPCRLEVQLAGLHVALLNRSYKYDELEKLAASMTGGGDKTAGAATASEGKAGYESTPFGSDGATWDFTPSAAPDPNDIPLLRQILSEELRPLFYRVFPAVKVEVTSGHLAVGSHALPVMLLLSWAQAAVLHTITPLPEHLRPKVGASAVVNAPHAVSKSLATHPEASSMTNEGTDDKGTAPGSSLPGVSTPSTAAPAYRSWMIVRATDARVQLTRNPDFGGQAALQKYNAQLSFGLSGTAPASTTHSGSVLPPDPTSISGSLNPGSSSSSSRVLRPPPPRVSLPAAGNQSSVALQASGSHDSATVIAPDPPSFASRMANARLPSGVGATGTIGRGGLALSRPTAAGAFIGSAVSDLRQGLQNALGELQHTMAEVKEVVGQAVNEVVRPGSSSNARLLPRPSRHASVSRLYGHRFSSQGSRIISASRGNIAVGGDEDLGNGSGLPSATSQLLPSLSTREVRSRRHTQRYLQNAAARGNSPRLSSLRGTNAQSLSVGIRREDESPAQDSRQRYFDGDVPTGGMEHVSSLSEIGHIISDVGKQSEHRFRQQLDRLASASGARRFTSLLRKRGVANTLRGGVSPGLETGVELTGFAARPRRASTGAIENRDFPPASIESVPSWIFTRNSSDDNDLRGTRSTPFIYDSQPSSAAGSSFSAFFSNVGTRVGLNNGRFSRDNVLRQLPLPDEQRRATTEPAVFLGSTRSDAGFRFHDKAGQGRGAYSSASHQNGHELDEPSTEHHFRMRPISSVEHAIGADDDPGAASDGMGDEDRDGALDDDEDVFDEEDLVRSESDRNRSERGSLAAPSPLKKFGQASRRLLTRMHQKTSAAMNGTLSSSHVNDPVMLPGSRRRHSRFSLRLHGGRIRGPSAPPDCGGRLPPVVPQVFPRSNRRLFVQRMPVPTDMTQAQAHQSLGSVPVVESAADAEDNRPTGRGVDADASGSVDVPTSGSAVAPPQSTASSSSFGASSTSSNYSARDAFRFLRDSRRMLHRAEPCVLRCHRLTLTYFVDYLPGYFDEGNSVRVDEKDTSKPEPSDATSPGGLAPHPETGLFMVLGTPRHEIEDIVQARRRRLVSSLAEAIGVDSAALAHLQLAHAMSSQAGNAVSSLAAQLIGAAAPRLDSPPPGRSRSPVLSMALTRARILSGLPSTMFSSGGGFGAASAGAFRLGIASASRFIFPPLPPGVPAQAFDALAGAANLLQAAGSASHPAPVLVQQLLQLASCAEKLDGAASQTRTTTPAVGSGSGSSVEDPPSGNRTTAGVVDGPLFSKGDSKRNASAVAAAAAALLRELCPDGEDGESLMQISPYPTTLCYGPWHEKHKNLLLRFFYPPAFSDWPLSATDCIPGTLREAGAFQLFCSVTEPLRIMVPFTAGAREGYSKSSAQATHRDPGRLSADLLGLYPATDVYGHGKAPPLEIRRPDTTDPTGSGGAHVAVDVTAGRASSIQEGKDGALPDLSPSMSEPASPTSTHTTHSQPHPTLSVSHLNRLLTAVLWPMSSSGNPFADNACGGIATSTGCDDNGSAQWDPWLAAQPPSSERPFTALETMAAHGPISAAIAAGRDCAWAVVTVQGCLDVSYSSGWLVTGREGTVSETRVMASGRVALLPPGSAPRGIPLIESNGLRVGMRTRYPRAWNGRVVTQTAVDINSPSVNYLACHGDALGDLGLQWIAATNPTPADIQWLTAAQVDLLSRPQFFVPSESATSVSASDVLVRLCANDGNVIDTPFDPLSNAHVLIHAPGFGAAVHSRYFDYGATHARMHVHARLAGSDLSEHEHLGASRKSSGSLRQLALSHSASCFTNRYHQQDGTGLSSDPSHVSFNAVAGSAVRRVPAAFTDFLQRSNGLMMSVQQHEAPAAAECLRTLAGPLMDFACPCHVECGGSHHVRVALALPPTHPAARIARIRQHSFASGVVAGSHAERPVLSPVYIQPVASLPVISLSGHRDSYQLTVPAGTLLSDEARATGAFLIMEELAEASERALLGSGSAAKPPSVPLALLQRLQDLAADTASRRQTVRTVLRLNLSVPSMLHVWASPEAVTAMFNLQSNYAGSTYHPVTSQEWMRDGCRNLRGHKRARPFTAFKSPSVIKNSGDPLQASAAVLSPVESPWAPTEGITQLLLPQICVLLPEKALDLPSAATQVGVSKTSASISICDASVESRYNSSGWELGVSTRPVAVFLPRRPTLPSDSSPPADSAPFTQFDEAISIDGVKYSMDLLCTPLGALAPAFSGSDMISRIAACAVPGKSSVQSDGEASTCPPTLQFPPCAPGSFLGPPVQYRTDVGVHVGAVKGDLGMAQLRALADSLNVWGAGWALAQAYPIGPHHTASLLPSVSSIETGRVSLSEIRRPVGVLHLRLHAAAVSPLVGLVRRGSRKHAPHPLTLAHQGGALVAASRPSTVSFIAPIIPSPSSAGIAHASSLMVVSASLSSHEATVTRASTTLMPTQGDTGLSRVRLQLGREHDPSSWKPLTASMLQQAYAASSAVSPAHVFGASSAEDAKRMAAVKPAPVRSTQLPLPLSSTVPRSHAPSLGSELSGVLLGNTCTSDVSPSAVAASGVVPCGVPNGDHFPGLNAPAVGTRHPLGALERSVGTSLPVPALAHIRPGTVLATDRHTLGVFVVAEAGGQTWRSSVVPVQFASWSHGPNDTATWDAGSTVDEGGFYMSSSSTSAPQAEDASGVAPVNLVTGGGATREALEAAADRIAPLHSIVGFDGPSAEKRANYQPHNITPTFNRPPQKPSNAPVGVHVSPECEWEWDGGGAFVSLPVYQPDAPLSLSLYECRRAWRYLPPPPPFVSHEPQHNGSLRTVVTQHCATIEQFVNPVLVGSSVLAMTELTNESGPLDRYGEAAVGLGSGRSIAELAAATVAGLPLPESPSTRTPCAPTDFTLPLHVRHLYESDSCFSRQWVNLWTPGADLPWVGGKLGDIQAGKELAGVDEPAALQRSKASLGGDSQSTLARLDVSLRFCAVEKFNPDFLSVGRAMAPDATVVVSAQPAPSGHSSHACSTGCNVFDAKNTGKVTGEHLKSLGLPQSQESLWLAVSPVMSRALHAIDLLEEAGAALASTFGVHTTTYSAPSLDVCVRLASPRSHAAASKNVATGPCLRVQALQGAQFSISSRADELGSGSCHGSVPAFSACVETSTRNFAHLHGETTGDALTVPLATLHSGLEFSLFDLRGTLRPNVPPAECSRPLSSSSIIQRTFISAADAIRQRRLEGGTLAGVSGMSDMISVVLRFPSDDVNEAAAATALHVRESLCLKANASVQSDRDVSSALLHPSDASKLLRLHKRFKDKRSALPTTDYDLLRSGFLEIPASHLATARPTLLSHRSTAVFASAYGDFADTGNSAQPSARVRSPASATGVAGVGLTTPSLVQSLSVYRRHATKLASPSKGTLLSSPLRTMQVAGNVSSSSDADSFVSALSEHDSDSSSESSLRETNIRAIRKTGALPAPITGNLDEPISRKSNDMLPPFSSTAHASGLKRFVPSPLYHKIVLSTSNDTNFQHADDEAHERKPLGPVSSDRIPSSVDGISCMTRVRVFPTRVSITREGLHGCAAIADMWAEPSSHALFMSLTSSLRTDHSDRHPPAPHSEGRLSVVAVACALRMSSLAATQRVLPPGAYVQPPLLSIAVAPPAATVSRVALSIERIHLRLLAYIRPEDDFDAVSTVTFQASAQSVTNSFDLHHGGSDGGGVLACSSVRFPATQLRVSVLSHESPPSRVPTISPFWRGCVFGVKHTELTPGELFVASSHDVVASTASVPSHSCGVPQGRSNSAELTASSSSASINIGVCSVVVAPHAAPALAAAAAAWVDVAAHLLAEITTGQSARTDARHSFHEFHSALDTLSERLAPWGHSSADLCCLLNQQAAVRAASQIPQSLQGSQPRGLFRVLAGCLLPSTSHSAQAKHVSAPLALSVGHGYELLALTDDIVVAQDVEAIKRQLFLTTPHVAAAAGFEGFSTQLSQFCGLAGSAVLCASPTEEQQQYRSLYRAIVAFQELDDVRQKAILSVLERKPAGNAKSPPIFRRPAFSAVGIAIEKLEMLVVDDNLSSGGRLESHGDSSALWPATSDPLLQFTLCKLAVTASREVNSYSLSQANVNALWNSGKTHRSARSVTSTRQLIDKQHEPSTNGLDSLFLHAFSSVQRVSWSANTLDVSVSPLVETFLSACDLAASAVGPLFLQHFPTFASSSIQLESSTSKMIGEEAAVSGRIGSVVVRAVSAAFASLSSPVPPSSVLLMASIGDALVHHVRASGCYAMTFARETSKAATEAQSSPLVTDEVLLSLNIGPRRHAAIAVRQPPDNSLWELRPMEAKTKSLVLTIGAAGFCATGGSSTTTRHVSGERGTSVSSGHSGESRRSTLSGSFPERGKTSTRALIQSAHHAQTALASSSSANSPRASLAATMSTPIATRSQSVALKEPLSGGSHGSDVASTVLVDITHTTPTRIRMTPDQLPVREAASQLEAVLGTEHDSNCLPPPASWSTLSQVLSCATDGYTALTANFTSASLLVSSAEGPASAQTTSYYLHAREAKVDVPLFGLDVPALFSCGEQWKTVLQGIPSTGQEPRSNAASMQDAELTHKRQYRIALGSAAVRVSPLDSLHVDYGLHRTLLSVCLRGGKVDIMATLAEHELTLGKVKRPKPHFWIGNGETGLVESLERSVSDYLPGRGVSEQSAGVERVATTGSEQSFFPSVHVVTSLLPVFYQMLYNRTVFTGVQLFRQVLPTLCIHGIGEHDTECHMTWSVDAFIDRMSNSITPQVYTHLLALQGRLSAEIAAVALLLNRLLSAPVVGSSPPLSVTDMPTPRSAALLGMTHSVNARVVQRGVLLKASSLWEGGTCGATVQLDTGIISVSFASTTGPKQQTLWQTSLSFEKLRMSLSEPERTSTIARQQHTGTLRPHQRNVAQLHGSRHASMFSKRMGLPGLRGSNNGLAYAEHFFPSDAASAVSHGELEAYELALPLPISSAFAVELAAELDAFDYYSKNGNFPSFLVSNEAPHSTAAREAQENYAGGLFVNSPGQSVNFVHVATEAVLARLTTDLHLSTGSGRGIAGDRPIENKLGGTIASCQVLITPAAATTVKLIVTQFQAATSEFVSRARSAWKTGRNQSARSLQHSAASNPTGDGVSEGATSASIAPSNVADLSVLWSKLQPVVTNGLEGARRSLLSSAAQASHFSFVLSLTNMLISMPYYTHAGLNARSSWRQPSAIVGANVDTSIFMSDSNSLAQSSAMHARPENRGEVSSFSRRSQIQPMLELGVISLESIVLEARTTNIMSSFVHAQNTPMPTSREHPISPDFGQSEPALSQPTILPKDTSQVVGDDSKSRDPLAIVETILRQMSGHVCCEASSLVIALLPSTAVPLALSTVTAWNMLPRQGGNSVELPSLTVIATIANESSTSTGDDAELLAFLPALQHRHEADSFSLTDAASRPERETASSHNIYAEAASSYSRGGNQSESHPRSHLAHDTTPMKVQLLLTASAPVVSADSVILRGIGGILNTWDAGMRRTVGTVLSSVTAPFDTVPFPQLSNGGSMDGGLPWFSSQPIDAYRAHNEDSELAAGSDSVSHSFQRGDGDDNDGQNDRDALSLSSSTILSDVSEPGVEDVLDTPLSLTLMVQLEPGHVTLYHDQSVNALQRDKASVFSVNLPRCSANGSINIPASALSSECNAAAVDVHFGSISVSPFLLVFVKEVASYAPCLSLTVGKDVAAGDVEVLHSAMIVDETNRGSASPQFDQVAYSSFIPSMLALPCAIVFTVHPFDIIATAHPVIDDLSVMLRVPTPIVMSVSAGQMPSQHHSQEDSYRSPLLFTGTLCAPVVEVVVAQRGRSEGASEHSVGSFALPGLLGNFGYLIQPTRSAPQVPSVLTAFVTATATTALLNGSRLREIMAFVHAWEMLYIQAQSSLSTIISANTASDVAVVSSQIEGNDVAVSVRAGQVSSRPHGLIMLSRASLSSVQVAVELEAVNDTHLTLSGRGISVHITDALPPTPLPRTANTLITVLVDTVEIRSVGHLSGGVTVDGVAVQWLSDFRTLADAGWPTPLSFKPALTWAAMQLASLHCDFRNAYTDARLASLALEACGLKLGTVLSGNTAVIEESPRPKVASPHPSAAADGDVGAPVEVRLTVSSSLLRSDVTADAAPFFIELGSDLSIFAAEEAHAARLAVDARIVELTGNAKIDSREPAHGADVGFQTMAWGRHQFSWHGLPHPGTASASPSDPGSVDQVDLSAVSTLPWGRLRSFVDTLVVNLHAVPSVDSLSVSVHGLHVDFAQHPEHSCDVGADRSFRLLGVSAHPAYVQSRGLCGVSPWDVLAVHRTLVVDVSKGHVHRIHAVAGGNAAPVVREHDVPSARADGNEASTSRGRAKGGSSVSKIMQFPQCQLQLDSMRFVAERRRHAPRTSGQLLSPGQFPLSALTSSHANAIALELEQEVWYTFYSDFRGSIHTTVNLKDFDWLSGIPRGVISVFVSRLLYARSQAAEAAAAIRQMLSDPVHPVDARATVAPAGDHPVFRANYEKAEADGRPSPLILDPQLAALGDLAVSNISWLLKRIGVESLATVPELLHDSVLVPCSAVLASGGRLTAALERVSGMSSVAYPSPDDVEDGTVP